MPLAIPYFWVIDPLLEGAFPAKVKVFLARHRPKSLTSAISSKHLCPQILSLVFCLFLSLPAVAADPAQKPEKASEPQAGPLAFARKAYAQTQAQHKKDLRDAAASCQ